MHASRFATQLLPTPRLRPVMLPQEGRVLQAALLLPVRHNRHPGVPAGAFCLLLFLGLFKPRGWLLHLEMMPLVFQQVRSVCILCSKLAGWLLHLEMLQGKAAHGYRVDSPRLAMPYVPHSPSPAAVPCRACCKQATAVPPLPQIFRDHYLRALYSLFPEDAAPKYILDAGGVGLWAAIGVLPGHSWYRYAQVAERAPALRWPPRACLGSWPPARLPADCADTNTGCTAPWLPSRSSL